MFNDEPDSNQKVMGDIVFDPEKDTIRVEISIKKYRDLIRNLMKANIESNLVIHDGLIFPLPDRELH